jgi:hypothetical protein
MNFEESYQKYLILSESNGTTDKLSSNKGRYAVKYNLAQNKVIEWLIESNSADENRYLQSIKEPYEELTLLSTKTDYSDFSLPKNYFDFINLKVLGSKGKCKNQLFKHKEVKGENVNNYFIDSNTMPRS